MNKIFLILILLVLSSFSYAEISFPQTVLMIESLIQGKISKQQFLNHLKAERFPYKVRDVEIVIYKGRRTLKWYIGGSDIIQNFKDGKVTQPVALKSLRQASPLYLSDIKLITKDGKKQVQWHFTNKPFLHRKVERKVASVIPIKTTIIQTKAVAETVPTSKKHTIAAGVQAGKVEIARGSKYLKMDIIKVGLSDSVTLNAKDLLHFNFALIKFYNLNYSESNSTASISSVFPEFGLGVSRGNDRLRVGLGYDYLNYLTLSKDTNTQVEFSPTGIHRLALKPNLYFTDSWNLFASFGYIKTFDSNSLTGLDASVGTTYLFGQKKRFSLSPVFYKSSIKGESDGENANSTAIMVSLNMTFN